MKQSLPALGATVLTLLLLVSFIIDAVNVAQGGAIDLRNRVTGARLLVTGTNPYTYKWVRADPEIYCDPYNNPRRPVSKTTATPALLALTIPLAELPYRLGQYLWLVLQWALLLGTAWLWWRQCAYFRQRALLGMLVTGFTYTAAWRLHAERGQSYVLLLFLFGLWLAATLNPEARQRFLTGLAAGLLMTLRPPFVLLFPFLAGRWRGQLLGAITGLLIGLALPLFFSSGIWTDYFSAMQTHSYLYRSDIDPPPGPQVYPPTVEGIPTDTLANYIAIPYADFSFHAALRWMGAEPFPALPVLLAGLVGFGIWAWRARRREPGRLLLGLAVWMFLIDLVLPAYRNSYNDVLALNILALGLVTAPRFSPGIVLGLCALLAGTALYVFAPLQAWVIDIPSLLLTLGALGYLVVPDLGPKLDSDTGSVQNEAC
jgi:hypothetical protein